MNTLIKIAALVPFVVALSACSSQPGDGDLQEALTNHYALLDKRMAQSMQPQIKAARVLSCTKVGDSKSYQCDVIGLSGFAQSMRLVKSDKGWVSVL